LIGVLLTVCILAAYIVYTFAGLDSFFSAASGERLIAVEDAIRKAAVQCYALEGSYPPDIIYLEQHYGIQLDNARFDYFYDTFGSNIMPQIKVYAKKTVRNQ
jgi:hypothetical protein